MKDLIKQKDATIKEAELQQQKMSEDRDKQQQEITDHKQTLVEQQTKIRELENDKVELTALLKKSEKERLDLKHKEYE